MPGLSGRTIIPQPKQFVYTFNPANQIYISHSARVFVRACRAPERSEACNDAHGAVRSCTVCGLIANRRSGGISCATMQQETPKDVSGIVAIPSGFESARRSASVALLGTLMASLFQCLEYDDEVRVELAHVLSQALPLFRGQGWDGSVNTVQRRGNIVHASVPHRSVVVAISFWDQKENAQAYHSSGYPEVLKILKQFLDGTPRVRTFDVVSSTVQKVAARFAA
jgi:hypothetical protein